MKLLNYGTGILTNNAQSFEKCKSSYLVGSNVGFLLELLQGPHEQAKHTPIPDGERHKQPDIIRRYTDAVKNQKAYRLIQTDQRLIPSHA